MEYIFTDHLRERYVERFRDKNANLKVYKERSIINHEIKVLVNSAEEVKRYLTDTNLMGYLYRRYGFDRRFSILENDNILFVVIHERGRHVIVTCFGQRGSVFEGRFVDYQDLKKKKRKHAPSSSNHQKTPNL